MNLFKKKSDYRINIKIPTWVTFHMLVKGIYFSQSSLICFHAFFFFFSDRLLILQRSPEHYIPKINDCQTERKKKKQFYLIVLKYIIELFLSSKTRRKIRNETSCNYFWKTHWNCGVWFTPAGDEALVLFQWEQLAIGHIFHWHLATACNKVNMYMW